MPWQKCFCCKRKGWRGGECHILPTKVQQQQPSSYSPVRDVWAGICPFPLSSIRTFQNGGHWMYPSGLFLETGSPSASQADPELAFTPGCPGTRDSLPSLSLSNAWIRGMSQPCLAALLRHWKREIKWVSKARVLHTLYFSWGRDCTVKKLSQGLGI